MICGIHFILNLHTGTILNFIGWSFIINVVISYKLFAHLHLFIMKYSFYKVLNKGFLTQSDSKGLIFMCIKN